MLGEVRVRIHFHREVDLRSVFMLLGQLRGRRKSIGQMQKINSPDGGIVWTL